ncbi:MAG TPA: SDR family oxidoreductase [Methylomirabilota bacterium]|nr:SDR family oxidoreductase [Methylomirabilota bacterium]
MPGGGVVITGASTGIGAECALSLDRLGFQVWACVRKTADGQALRAKASLRFTPLLLDVTDRASITRAAADVDAALGAAGLAGLVNNAGIVVAGPVELLPLEEVRKQLEVNVVGQIAVTQAFLPLLRRGQGRIVNIGSISGRMATPLMGAYSASKFALEAITDALRLEVAPWGIHVAIVEPGAVATPLWQRGTSAAEVMYAGVPEEKRALYATARERVLKAARHAERNAIPPEAVARAVAHALTAKKPRTRYLVGRDARIQALLARWIPDRIRDGIIRKFMRLPR